MHLLSDGEGELAALDIESSPMLDECQDNLNRNHKKIQAKKTKTSTIIHGVEKLDLLMEKPD
jgi:hypothetical protein